MARLNTREIKRSRTSADSKLVFDDEEPLIILGEPIMSADDLAVVNQKMKRSYCSWSNGYGLISFLYKKPSIHKIKGKRINVDYFTEEDHVKQYDKSKYGCLGIADTTYGDNASIDENYVFDTPAMTTSKSFLSKQQTTILP